MESQHQDRGRFHGTFRKHGYTHLPKGRSPRQAHRDVETTPCSARGEEDRIKQAPGKRPEERMGLLDSAIQTRHRQSGGKLPPRKLQEETTRRGEPLQNPDQEPWSDTTPKEKVREKMGGKPPSCRTSHPKGKQAAKWKPRRKNAQRRTATQPTKSQTTFKHPRSRSPRGDQAGAG